MPVRLPSLLGLFNRSLRRQRFRRFDGAAGGRRGWGMGTFHRINPEVAAGGASLRARARYLANNNPWIVNAIGNWVGALGGFGVTPTSQHSDAAARKALATLFNGWADEADADGRTTFWGLQADVARGLVVDGECFDQFLDTDDGVRLRLIPPELIDESMTRELGNGAVIVQGVEFDADGRRVAYHVLPSLPYDQFFTHVPPVWIEASEVLHYVRYGNLPLESQDVMIRRAVLAAETFDKSAMTVEATISTFSDVNRSDGRGAYVERLDPTGLDASRLVGAPVLDGHRQASARDTIGVVTAYRTEGNALASTIRLLLRGDRPQPLRHDRRPAERHVLGLFSICGDFAPDKAPPPQNRAGP